MEKISKINEFYKSLFEQYGRQNWWPAENKLECILGAILTQNTSWNNVEKAIFKLKENKLIDLTKLNKIKVGELAKIIRSSGYYNQKAKCIKNFIKFIVIEYEGNLDLMQNEDFNVLREKLINIKGIGFETADTILLYAFNKPAFVIDKYTYRMLSRHKLIPEQTNYQEMQELFVNSIGSNPVIYNEFHALIVKVGKEHCKRTADCIGCPLEYDIQN